MLCYKTVTHVLFDMDGLILNTEDLYTTVFQEVLGRYGKKYTYDLKKTVMGLQNHESAEIIIKALEVPMTPKEFIDETKLLFENMFPQSKLMPGAKKLIEHLHNSGVPIGLATSSSKESYELKTRHHGDVFSLFAYNTWGSSDPKVKKGKPSPDIFLVATTKFPDVPKPEQVLVFEDAVNGVKAANAAGMQVVMVPDPRLPREDTRAATLVLDSLEQFQPELFGLPAYGEIL